MNRVELEKIFKSSYESSSWKNFLKKLFKDISASYFKTPVDLKDESLVKHKDVAHIWEYGNITLSDSKIIKFYEVELKKNQQVTKNRVGLRNIVSGEIGFSYIDGAIITYYNKNDSDWRFTFISKSLYWDEDNNEVKTETHPKRYTYLLGENETVKTALNQFEWLFNQIKTRDINLEDILKAFSVEKLSKEFYDGYFHQYETFVSYIVDNPKAFNHFLNQIAVSDTLEEKHKKAEHLVSDFVKKFLGRIVFLFFLQKKGWMGVPINKEWGEGQLDFLFRLFEEFKDKNNFYEKALVPLFFNTLNVDRTKNKDIFSVTNTRIPYLNGGLFEKNETEPENIQFEPQRFTDLLAFFSHYNFTVDESSPDDQDIGVDPEMLGHIFENLLEDNKDKGAFYTPKEIVHYMTQESLIEYLNTHLKNTAKEHLTVFVKQKKQGTLSENELEEINSSLSKLKILDPAIGSGAFPMGLLHEIFALKGLIAFEKGYKAWSPARVKERIIENSIYGVDIEEGAVDIARLRFWLSLIVDEPTPRPLPNLDYKIISGNSLISRYSLVTPINEVFRDFNKNRSEEDKVDLAKYKALVNDYMHEANHDKKEEFKQLIEDVKNAFKTHFSSKENNKIIKLKAALNSYNLHGLFKHQQTVAEKQRNTKLKKNIAKLQQEKKDREEGKIFKEAVEWRFEFPNLLDKDGNFEGFDIVIGNPPYVSAVTMRRNEEIKQYFKKRFPLISGSYDLYTLFLLQGKNLLNNKGIYSWIIPNKFLIADYAKKTKEHLINKGLNSSLNVSSFNVFKGVGVYPIILLGNVIGKKTGLVEYYLQDYSDLKLNNLTPVELLPEYKTLKDFDVKINSGSTGFQAKIVKQFVTEECSQNTIPFTVSGNVDRYIYNNTSVKFMKNTYSNAFIHYNNEIADSKWDFWNSPKIVVAGMTKEIEAVYVESPLGLGVGIYGIFDYAGMEPFALTAILNSKYLTYYFKKKFKDNHLAGGYLAINKSTIEQFPIVKPENEYSFTTLSMFIHKLRNNIDALNEFVTNSHISKTFEEVIDAMVFELYFPKEFEKAGLHFIKYAERDFKTIVGLTPEEQKEIIHNSYQKLREKDNEIRNNLKKMKIELRDLLMPILTV